MDQDKKTILIPGWMNGGGMYGGKDRLYNILEIWKEKLEIEEKIEATYLISHSLGCNWALLSWEKNKNTKLILVNPLLPKRKIKEWFSRWVEFGKKERKPKNKEVVWGLRNIFFGLRMCWKLLAYDFGEILNNIPKEDIIIICGEKDVFYCDEEFKRYIRSKNIKLVEVRDVGHDWHENFDQEIERMIE